MCQMMQELGDVRYNEGWKGGWAEGKAEGWAEGKTEGWESGMAKGWESGMAKGWEGGRADGIAEGKAEGARMTAQNLKKLGMDSVIIAGAVGYDTETVENWIKEYENHSL